MINYITYYGKKTNMPGCNTELKLSIILTTFDGIPRKYWKFPESKKGQIFGYILKNVVGVLPGSQGFLFLVVFFSSPPVRKERGLKCD